MLFFQPRSFLLPRRFVFDRQCFPLSSDNCGDFIVTQAYILRIVSSKLSVRLCPKEKAFVGRLGDSIGFMCACSNETSVVVDAIGSGTGSGSCSSAVTTFVADVDNFRLLEGGEDGGVGRDTGLTPTGKVLLGLFRSSGFCINPNFATLS